MFIFLNHAAATCNYVNKWEKTDQFLVASVSHIDLTEIVKHFEYDGWMIVRMVFAGDSQEARWITAHKLVLSWTRVSGYCCEGKGFCRVMAHLRIMCIDYSSRKLRRLAIRGPVKSNHIEDT